MARRARAKAQRMARRAINRQVAMATRMLSPRIRMRVRAQVRMATADNRLTMRELMRIRRITMMMGGRQLVMKIRQTAMMNKRIKIGGMNPKRNKPANQEYTSPGNKPGVVKKATPTVVSGVARSKEGKGKGNKGKKGKYMPPINSKKDLKKEKKLGKKRDKVIKKHRLPLPKNNKGYKKFNYTKAIKKADAKAKMQDKKLRKLQQKPMKIFTNKQTMKFIMRIGKKTGFNKVKMRIGKDGLLMDKKGVKAAMAPSFAKFKRERDNIKGLYPGKFMMLAMKLGVAYDERSRAMRTRQRLTDLTMRLGSMKIFGSKNRGGYGSQGIDQIQKFTDTKIKVPKPKKKGPVQQRGGKPKTTKWGTPNTNKITKKYGR